MTDIRRQVLVLARQSRAPRDSSKISKARRPLERRWFQRTRRTRGGTNPLTDPRTPSNGARYRPESGGDGIGYPVSSKDQANRSLKSLAHSSQIHRSSSVVQPKRRASSSTARSQNLAAQNSQ